MALDAQRALLDQLMGRDRNRNADSFDGQPRTKWHDDVVCKYHLCGFCPCELFTNTRSDLGICEKVHDDLLRKEFQDESDSIKRPYEKTMIRYLESIVITLDRKIERGRERLKLSNPQTIPKNIDPNADQRRMKIEEIDKKIEEYTATAELLGSEGKIDASAETLKEIEMLESQKKAIEKQTEQMVNQLTGNAARLQVCEICGAFVGITDSETRIVTHLSGKQHVGFKMIREKLAELREKLATQESNDPSTKQQNGTANAPKYESVRLRSTSNQHNDTLSHATRRSSNRDRSDRDGHKDRDRSHRDRSSRYSDRDRGDRDRDRHSSSRYRSSESRRDKDRSRDRSRDRSSRHRDTDRDRDRDGDRNGDADRDRDRDRERDRDRHRRSHSSRSRHHGSRSGSRSRSSRK